jgi:hypothetical protein
MKEFNFKIDRKLSTMQVGKNKYKFAIDKTGATDINITQDKIEDVIYSVFDSSEFLDLVRIITNIKGTQKIPKIYLQGLNGSGNGLVDSTGCGFVDTTDMVISDVDISVTKKRMGLELCLDELVNMVLEVHISDGARNESLDINEALLAYFAQVLRKNIQEYAFADGTDGLLTKILTDGTAPIISATDPLEILLALYENLPSGWQTSNEANPVIFINSAMMTAIRGQIFSSTAPITSSIEIVNNRFNLPLTNAVVVASPHMPISGTKMRAVAGISNYLFLATDLESDFDDVRVWYSNDNETIRFSSQIYLGTAIADVESFVKYIEA